jgi:hypothetical protein
LFARELRKRLATRFACENAYRVLLRGEQRGDLRVEAFLHVRPLAEPTQALELRKVLERLESTRRYFSRVERSEVEGRQERQTKNAPLNPSC